MAITIDLRMYAYAGDSVRIERQATVTIDGPERMLRVVSVPLDANPSDLVAIDPHIIKHVGEEIRVEYPLLETIMKAVFEGGERQV